MREILRDANEELKRVDHLVYVSLKYTRTVDVILNILNRMIDSYAFMMDALLKKAEDEGQIFEEPFSAIERAELVQKLFKEDVGISDNVELYLLLRKLHRAKSIERENEYRRHVTMKTIIDGREEIVNIDIITNYFLFQREFLDHLHKLLNVEKKQPEGLF